MNRRLFVIATLSLLAACTAQPPSRPIAPAASADPHQIAAAALEITPGPGRPGDDALYRAMGQLPGIGRLVDTLLAEIANDLRINLLFADTDMPYLRARLIEQLCEAAGGPCTYTGLPMPEAHSGQRITPEQFGYFVEDLDRAMARVGLDAATQNTLRSVLGGMRDEVIGL
jgi:hemoglobin